MTFYVSPEIAARVRGAVVGLRQQNVKVSLADVADAALDHYVAQLEREHNHGASWPDPGPLHGGRPTKAHPVEG